MWALILLLVVSLHTVSVTTEDCRKCKDASDKTCNLNWSYFVNCTDVNLSSNNIVDIKPSPDHTTITTIKKLDLSNNKLTKLPDDFLSNAADLEEINLANNSLEALPLHFLNRSSKLRVAHLNGNPLTEIPSSLFHPGLLNLSVDCRCDVASSIIPHQTTNSPKLHAVCFTSSTVLNVGDFLAWSCGSPMLLALYIIMPIVVVGLVIGGVLLYLWKKKNNSSNLESKSAPEEHSAQWQPRYMTRRTDVPAETSNQSPTRDYENVFVGNPNPKVLKPYEYMKEQSRPGMPSKQAMDEGLYLESDVNEGDQPIYTNTQSVYYSYQETSHNVNKEEDDVYILPDQ